jgi:signal transduction histidine kinase
MSSERGRRLLKLKGAGRPTSLWASNVPVRRALVLTGALLLLALCTTWLLERRASTAADTRFTARGRALAEIVAQAAGADSTFADPSRLLRILESATRQGGLIAGAIVNDAGAIVAHTDMARAGEHVALLPIDFSGAEQPPSDVQRELFGNVPGAIILYPLLDANGSAGLVALLLPRSSHALFGAGWLQTFLPAGLIVLAFLGLTQMTTRWALRPASEFLERLAHVLEPKSALGEAGDWQPCPAQAELSDVVSPERVLERTVNWVEEMHAARESLTIENRMLEYERRRAALVLEHFPEGIILTDALDEVVLVNRAAAALFGLTRDHPGQVPTVELPGEVRQLLAEASRTGRVMHAAACGEKTRQLLISRTSLGDGQERGTGLIFLVRDVTAQRAAQQAQAEFLSQITHELKSPLNTIVAYIEALTDEENLGSDERKEFYNTLNTEALRMARLISNLLQLSRIQLGNLSAKFGYVKPDALVRTLSDAISAQVESHHQRLEVHVPDNLPPLYGDKDLIGVAITNLLTNAIKYTPEGGQIIVRAGEADGGVAIEVIDNGIGIPPEAQARIFERFARSEQEEVQRQSGTGLGLALVKEIAEIHEGNIAVDSRLGQGSRFRLWFPSREVGTRLDVGAAA